MDIIELVIDENDEYSGIEAISVVSAPAIEENFITLKDKQQIRLAEVSKEKRLLMGAALIPDKPIYRKTDDHEFYIYFSKETVAKASQLFLKSGNQGQATMEHASEKLDGMVVVESWLVESEVHDKSRMYGLEMPIGTWMVSMKIDNNLVWEKARKNLIKGFSIEGYFADKMSQRPKDKQIDQLNEDDKLLNDIIDVLKESKSNTK
tara:strand:- start:2285 stop:2902 length:618 start_codon:yes stop_codon:yes gene_type:complete